MSNTEGNTPIEVTVRSLTKEDMKPISQALEEHGRSKEIFSVAPYKSRFTLPVVTVNGTGPDGSMTEEYLSLPTLGVNLLGQSGFRIRSKWAYMKVDEKALELLGWLRPEKIHSGSRSFSGEVSSRIRSGD
jgi:hypothetical protein